MDACRKIRGYRSAGGDTTMERNDIQASELSRYYVAMHKIIDPVAQSRNDFDIFAELAQRLGFG